MKTIEILSNGREVQFTTKSVTVAGKEYPYSHITELRHSGAKRIYGFKCDDEVVLLPYEEKDAKVLKAIFSQVQQMHRRPAPAKAPAKAEPAPAAAPPVQEAPVETPAAPAETPAAEVPVETPAVEEAPIEAPATEAPAVEEAPATEAPAEETPTVEEAPAETPATEEAPVAEVPTEETPAEEPILTAKERKRKEKEQRKADKEAAKREKQARKAGGQVAYEETSAAADPALNSARFKKGIIIFLIILAVFALLGVAYWFLIGPASDPQIGPNTTDQTQYNDIDDMINDLEN